MNLHICTVALSLSLSDFFLLTAVLFQSFRKKRNSSGERSKRAVSVRCDFPEVPKVSQGA